MYLELKSSERSSTPYGAKLRKTDFPLKLHYYFVVVPAEVAEEDGWKMQNEL
jgi:hypothetical protein